MKNGCRWKRCEEISGAAETVQKDMEGKALLHVGQLTDFHGIWSKGTSFIAVTGLRR